MTHDARLDAERDALDAAIDALLRGESIDAVAARQPEDLRPLIAAGGDLRRHRPAGDAPWAGFVLGLGEQLRTDLRIALVDPPAADAAVAAPRTPADTPRRSALDWRPIALAGLVIGFLAGLVVRSGGAEPGDTLYPVKQGLALAGLEPPPGGPSPIEAHLDAAWQRLGELEQLVEGGGGSAAEIDALVDEVLSGYNDAMALAALAEDDARVLRRARADADAAAAVLDRLALGRSAVVQTALAGASDRLRLRIAAAVLPVPAEGSTGSPPQLRPGGERIVLVPPATAAPGQAPPSPAPTAPSAPTVAPTRAPEPTAEPTSTPATPVAPAMTPTAPATATAASLPPAPGGATATATPLPATLVAPPPTPTRTALASPTAANEGPPSPSPTAVRSATATRPAPASPTSPPTVTPTRRIPDPPPPTIAPPTVSAPTATPDGQPPTPKPPPTDPANPTATPPPAPTAPPPTAAPSPTAVDPGDPPGLRRRGR